MKKRGIVTLVSLSIISSVFAVSSQVSHSKSGVPKFSSVYTDLNRDCKSALTRREEKEAEARGTDIPERCKGYGGYYVDVGYSAMASSISIYKQGSDDSIGLGMYPLNYVDEKGRKIEWRMAEGKPFAVIIRVPEYNDKGTSSADIWDPKNKIGESLRVRGLKGYENIEAKVDAKTPNANVKARELADNAFLKGNAG
ncbi:MAG TPA: hypothetical protein VM095_20410 [Pyrinomonadaceae bacterium]|nr:hypothetical protein [Pyrinomonadaceae bacterium]